MCNRIIQVGILVLLGTVVTASADDFAIGDLTIHSPYLRATPPGAPTAAGYLLIKNNGTTPDKLIGATANFASRGEIHETRKDGNLMKMQHIEGGLEIAANSQVALKPMSYHIMFMGLNQQLIAGDNASIVLQFENAGALEISVPVNEIGSMSSSDTEDNARHEHEHHKTKKE